VRAIKSDTQEQVTAVWPDGRIATIHGLRKSHHNFGVTIHREKRFQFVDCAAPGKRSWYASMLDAILRSLPKGKSDVDPADTIEVIRLIEAANESRESGAIVKL
jgi:predicted dehydrogenase